MKICRIQSSGSLVLLRAFWGWALRIFSAVAPRLLFVALFCFDVLLAVVASTSWVSLPTWLGFQLTGCALCSCFDVRSSKSGTSARIARVCPTKPVIVDQR